MLNNYKIYIVKLISFLRIILDENLTWKSHISHIARKISKSIGVMKKASFYVSESSLKMLYFSLTYPCMQYCTLVWGSTYPSNLNRIVLPQKKAVRIIGKEAYDAYTEPIFQRLKILTFNQTYWFHLRKFMYTYLYHRQMLPLNFNSFFQHISEIHVYNTRNSSLYAVPYLASVAGS